VPLPVVTGLDAIDDAAWFEAHPQRRFRVQRVPGGPTIIRQARAVFLRTFVGAATAIVDDDISLALSWFSAAYPTWNPEQVRKRALKALKGGRE
jgi:hypothetical protein